MDLLFGLTFGVYFFDGVIDFFGLEADVGRDFEELLAALFIAASFLLAPDLVDPAGFFF